MSVVMEREEVMKFEEARKYVGLARATMYKRIREKKIRARQDSRGYTFLKSDLDTYIKSTFTMPEQPPGEQ